MHARAQRWIREAISLAVTLSVVLVGRAALADQYVVPSGSMEPTVQVGDHVVVAKASYGIRVPFTEQYLVRFRAPQRGEVVVLDSPEDDHVLLKRIAALPRDEVAVQHGALIVNGAQVPWRQTTDGVEELSDAGAHPLGLDRGGGPDFGPTRVPDGKLLVLGDHRGDSRDGRYFGFVEQRSVLGHALGVFWRGGPTWRGL
ncbi:MAG: signal peptidase I [Deltaproteobacteria bacterium]|nr:signal peptidase I [Deltaproteobacteria bacterium]